RVAVVRPYRGGVAREEVAVRRPRVEGVELGELAREDALELRTVGAAARLARFRQDAVLAAERRDRGVRDRLGVGDEALVAGRAPELDEARDEDALVVG